MILLLSHIYEYASLFGQSCDFTTGPVTIAVNGGNQTDQYTTDYILTDFSGTILAINNQSPDFEIGEEGFYVAYALNYLVGTTFSGLAVGEHIDFINANDCFDLSLPYGFTVCAEISTCNYCLGETVILTSSGGNSSPGFTTM